MNPAAVDTTVVSVAAVIPIRYVEALGGKEPIESMRKAPKRVKKLVRDLSEKQLAKRPAEGKWSIKEVVGHLADGEIILGARLRFVAAMDRPPLPGYDENLFVQRLGIERTKTKNLLAAFAAVRAVNVDLLARLEEDALDRVGMHSERGEQSIRTMIAMYAGHDMIHENQIQRVREVLRASKIEKKAKKKADAAREKQEAAMLASSKKARKAEEKKKAASPAPEEPRKSKSAGKKNTTVGAAM